MKLISIIIDKDDGGYRVSVDTDQSTTYERFEDYRDLIAVLENKLKYYEDISISH